MSPTGLSEAALREKLSAPRPLLLVEGALYGPPLAGSTRAWLAWPADAGCARALDAVIARAARDGAATLTAGGPPGNYLVSGVARDDDDARRFFEARGFVASGAHEDLTVATEGHAADPAVQRADDDATVAWIAARFSSTWAMEATRARAHRGLFVMREGGRPVGFAAHSGNRAWEGTFGPVGVVDEARGAGAGRRLARTVLADLAARGFAEATVPWVEPGTTRFYRSFCAVRASAGRVQYRLDLGAWAPRRGA